jgi:hypothetical protein
MAAHRRDLKDVIQQARDQGWEVRLTNGGHYCFRAPNGTQVFGASTPSDVRSIANLRARLKRNGFREA